MQGDVGGKLVIEIVGAVCEAFSCPAEESSPRCFLATAFLHFVKHRMSVGTSEGPSDALLMLSCPRLGEEEGLSQPRSSTCCFRFSTMVDAQILKEGQLTSKTQPAAYAHWPASCGVANGHGLTQASVEVWPLVG